MHAVQQRETLKEDTAKRPSRLLIDWAPVSLALVERGDGGKCVVRGEFARADIATENKRLYKRSLWERELKRLGDALQERRILGELDHPSDGRTQLARVSHIVTGLSVDENGLVVGEAEIMPTAKGKDLEALLRSGARIGVSSRGYGSTATNEKGEDVVQEDYRLVTFDFVAEPANRTSYPDVFYEEREGEMGDTKNLTEQPASSGTKEELAEMVLKIVAEKRDDIREQERSKLLSDPDVAAASKIVEQIKELVRPMVIPEDSERVLKEKDADVAKARNQLAEANLKIASLEEELAKVAEAAREAGYRFFVERTISGDPNADLIRNVVGDVRMYEDIESLQTKIGSVRTELARRERQTEVEDRRRQREMKVAAEDRKVLHSKFETLQEALSKSTELNKALVVELYAEKRLANHPQAGKIRSLIESAKPNSKEMVDEIMENYKAPKRDPDELEAIRSRIRAVTKGGRGSSPLEEEAGTPAPERGTGRNATDYNGLGVDLAQLKRLSGLPQN